MCPCCYYWLLYKTAHFSSIDDCPGHFVLFVGCFPIFSSIHSNTSPPSLISTLVYIHTQFWVHFLQINANIRGSRMLLLSNSIFQHNVVYMSMFYAHRPAAFCVCVVSRPISSCTVSGRWQFPLIAQVGVQVPAPIEAAITAVLCRK